MDCIFQMYRNIIGRAKESSETFINSLETHCSAKAISISMIIFLLTFAGFAGLTSNAFINGDTAVYAHQIAHLDFAHRTIHLAYYMIGALFTWLIPGSNDYALNLMNCLFGALSISLIYLMAFTIFQKHIIATISSLFLVTNYFFIVNSLYAEIYILQVFFLLLALQCWLLNKPIAAGLAFTLSILVTPSSILAIPCFVILRPQKKALLRLGLTLLILLAIALLPRLDEYLFGNRGLLSVSRQVNVGITAVKEGYEVIFGLFLYIPFILSGITEVAKQKKLQVFGIAILSLWILNFLIIDRFRDVPAQLPFYALLCLIGGLGFSRSVYFMTTKTIDKVAMKDLWLLSCTALVMISLQGIAIKIGKTPAQISLTHISLFLPISLFALVALYAVIVTLMVKIFGRVKLIYSSAILAMLILFVGANSYLSFTLVSKLKHELTEFRSSALEVERVAQSDYLVVGDWSQGILFEHYVFGKFETGYWINTECLLSDSRDSPKCEESIKKWQNSIVSGKEIWLLGDYPSLVSDLRTSGYTVRPSKNIYRATVQN